MHPRRTTSLGESDCTCAPSNTIEPLVTSPRSEWSRLEIALSVVVLPDPLAPRSATMPPFCTDSDTPLSTRMTISRWLVARLRPLRPTRIRLHVVVGGALDQRHHFVLDRLNRRHRRMPFGAIPLDQRDTGMAVMVGAGQMDRRSKAVHAQFLPALRGDVEILETAAHVFAVDDFLAGQFLGRADRFCDDCRIENTAIVEILAGLIFRRDLALTLIDDVLDDILDYRIVGTDTVDIERAIALGIGAGRTRIVVAAGPPAADQLVHGKADLN